MSFHTHNQRLPMITSFCDIQVGGEDFVFEIGACGNYYDLVDSNVLRSYSVSYGLGPKCIFIPQFERSLTFTAPGTFFDEKLPKNRKAVRHLLTMLMMHDIDSWYATPETFALTKLRKDFGWDEDTIFTPFWNTEGFFTIKKESNSWRFTIFAAVLMLAVAWIVSFIIYSPEDGTKDDAAGLYVISVGSADGKVRSIRKQGLYDSEAFACVPEAAYEKAWEGIPRGDDVIRTATDAAMEKYPELDLTNEDKYELIADSFGSWCVTFRAKDVHLANVSVEFSKEGEIMSVEADSFEPDGDQLFSRYWQAYGYFGEWDQAVWVQLGKDMAGLEPETIEAKLLKATRYPEEASVKIRKEEAKELGVIATGKRVAEVNTCTLVDADPHPVWIMRILTEDEPEPVIGIDAETGAVAFTEQYKVDYTPHYVLYSMPETWRKTELEMLGVPHMAKTAITCKFADMWLDFPEIEVDNPENWEMEQDGLTIRFTGRWKGMKDYVVELDENGFVIRCEESASAATEEKPGGWPEEEDEW